MILQGDVLDQLATIDDESVQCVVTSPPYWRLRDYGVDGQIGLEPTLEEYIAKMVAVFSEVKRVLRKDGTLWLNMGDSYARQAGDDSKKTINKFGGRHGPQEAGVIKSGNNTAPPGLKPKDMIGMPWRIAFALQADGWWLRSDNIEEVELYCPCGCGYILEERIWRYSQDREIIWHKPNPMPESVPDRPTKSHEYIFLFAKSGKSQYWVHRNHSATRDRPKPDYRYEHVTGYKLTEPPEDWKTNIIDCPECDGEGKIKSYSMTESLFGDDTMYGYIGCTMCDDKDNEQTGIKAGQLKEWKRINLWVGCDYYYDAEAIKTGAADSTIADKRGNEDGNRSDRNYPGNPSNGSTNLGGKSWPGIGPQHGAERDRGEKYEPMATHQKVNRRTVWTIPTQAYPDAHFATFPEMIPKLCILAGSSAKGCCSKCGAPWVRGKISTGHINKREPAHVPGNTRTKTDSTGWKPTSVSTNEWQPSCECDAEIIPCTVLDPFLGSGTTLKVAQELGRKGIGIELNPEYVELAKKRTKHPQGLLPL